MLTYMCYKNQQATDNSILSVVYMRQRKEDRERNSNEFSVTLVKIKIAYKIEVSGK